MSEIIHEAAKKVICPVCGVGHIDAGITIVPKAGLVSRDGVAAYISPREMDVFMVLHRRAGMIVDRNTILDQVYQLRDKEPDFKIIDVMICKLRRALKPLGIKIITAWGTGYALDLKSGDKGKIIEMKEGAS